MNEIKIFQNEQFGQIRIVVNENNEPLFCLADVSKVLGYSRPADAVNQHCKGVVILPTPHKWRCTRHKVRQGKRGLSSDYEI